MTHTENHLIRAELSDEPGVRELSRRTGLSHLVVEEHRLETAAQIELLPGREQFLYVLSGSGNISATDASRTEGEAGSSADQTAVLASGDFITLDSTESAILSGTGSGLVILIGKGPRESRDD